MLTVNRDKIFGDMEALRKHYKEMLDILCEVYGLNMALTEYNNASGVRYNWELLDDAAEDHGLWFSSGATRLIIGDDDRDFIIKFQPYEDNRGHDYCKFEYDTYKAAVAVGLDDYFCPIEFLFDYHFGDRVCGIYVMPYCSCDAEGIEDDSYDYQYRTFCSDNGYDVDDEDARDEFCYDYDSDGCLIELALDIWGRHSDYDALCDFLRNWGCNDLHTGNWGYLENKLVLVDYAGYGSRDGFDF